MQTEAGTSTLRGSRVQHAGSMLLAWTTALAVAVVPLLVDLSNLDDTYYGGKARALSILAPAIVVALLVSRGIPVLRRSGLLPPLLGFIAVVSLATACSVNPLWSVFGAPRRHEGLLSLAAYAVVCAGTLVSVARGGLRLWLTAALAGGTLAATYGIAQYFGLEWLVRDATRLSWWRPFSTSGNPNFLGAYMVLMIPLAVAALMTARRPVTVALSGVALAAAGLAALCTYSRAAWLGVIVAFLALSVLLAVSPRAGRPRQAHRRLAASAALLAVLMIVFFVPASPLANRRADWSAAARARPGAAAEDATGGLQGRLYLWRHALPLWRARPILGYGPETFVRVFPQGWDAQRTRLFGNMPLLIDKAHNDTMDLAMSAGVLGVAAFWWVLLRTATRTYEGIRRGGPLQIAAIGMLAAGAGYWVDVQWHFSTVSVAPVFWSALGAAVGLAARAVPGGS